MLNSRPAAVNRAGGWNGGVLHLRGLMIFTARDAHPIGEALVRRWSTEAELSLELLERTDHGSVFGFRHAPFARGAKQRADDIDGALARVWIGRVHVYTVLDRVADGGLPLRLARRMARDPLPWFLLRIELGEDAAPARVYLTHIVQGALFSILAQTFAPPAGGSNDTPRLDVTPPPGDALPLPTAAWLRTGIIAAATDLPTYARDKVRLLRAGDSSWAHRQIVFTSGASVVTAAQRESMIDFALGMRPSLSTADFLAGDDHLDIALSAGESRAPGRVELPWPPSLGNIRLVVSDQELAEQVSLDCELYSPTTLFEGVLREEMRRRYVSPLVSIVTSARAPHASLVWHVPLPGAVRLADLDTAGRITSLFASARPLRHLWITRGESLSWLVAVRSEPQIFSPEVGELAEASRDAANLAVRFGLPFDMTVDGSQLHADRARLRTLARLLDPATVPEAITVVVERPLTGTNRPATIVLSLTARLGETMLTAVVERTDRGMLIKKEERCSLEVRRGEVRVLEMNAEDAATWRPEALRSRAHAAAVRIASEDRSGIVVFAPDEPRAAEVIRG